MSKGKQYQIYNSRTGCWILCEYGKPGTFVENSKQKFPGVPVKDDSGPEETEVLEVEEIPEDVDKDTHEDSDWGFE